MTKQSTIPVALATALPEPETFYAAFFDMLADHGLQQSTLARLAATHHWPLAQIRHAYPTIGHIVAGFSDFVTQQIDDMVVPDTAATLRDLYFELLMARLDTLQTYRDGFIRLLRDAPSRPDIALILLRQSQQAIHAVTDRAGWSGAVWQRPLHHIALMALMTRLLYVWQKDETADLSKSMAFLDERLDKLERYFPTQKDADA